MTLSRFADFVATGLFFSLGAVLSVLFVASAIEIVQELRGRK